MHPELYTAGKTSGDIKIEGVLCAAAGVDFTQDDTLPGAMLRMEGQSLVIRDSTFSNLAAGAPATLIVINSTLTITNTTFAGNSQAAAGALFLNGSSVVIYDSLFDRNKGGRSVLVFNILSSLSRPSMSSLVTVIACNLGSMPCVSHAFGSMAGLVIIGRALMVLAGLSKFCHNLSDCDQMVTFEGCSNRVSGRSHQRHRADQSARQPDCLPRQQWVSGGQSTRCISATSLWSDQSRNLSLEHSHHSRFKGAKHRERYVRAEC